MIQICTVLDLFKNLTITGSLSVKDTSFLYTSLFLYIGLVSEVCNYFNISDQSGVTVVRMFTHMEHHL